MIWDCSTLIAKNQLNLGSIWAHQFRVPGLFIALKLMEDRQQIVSSRENSDSDGTNAAGGEAASNDPGVLHAHLEAVGPRLQLPRGSRRMVSIPTWVPCS